MSYAIERVASSITGYKYLAISSKKLKLNKN